MDVLILCTANVCRSPLGEAFLSFGLQRRGVDDVRVSSAGFLPGGQPVADEVLRVLDERGVPTDGLTPSAQVTAADLREAELVVAMARHHVREAVVLEPTSFGRTFTLKELVRRGNETRPRAAGEELGAWLGEMAPERTPHDLLGDVEADDVPDPVGLSLRVFRKTATVLESLTAELCELAWPPAVRSTEEMTG